MESPFLPAPEGGGDPPQLLEEGEEGALAPVAASILMNILYGARAARWDLLKIARLRATRITKWSKDGGRALHHLICYMYFY